MKPAMILWLVMFFLYLILTGRAEKVFSAYKVGTGTVGEPCTNCH